MVTFFFHHAIASVDHFFYFQLRQEGIRNYMLLFVFDRLSKKQVINHLTVLSEPIDGY